ncbi:MAG: AP2/ERF family transcription factor [Planctomycetota bacterium]
MYAIISFFNIQQWLQRIWLFPLLVYRRFRYGYPFLRIPLTRGEFAIVDPEDYPRLAKHKWHLAKSPTGSYAVRWKRGPVKNTRRRIWMHRQVIHIPRSLLCDHVNCNSLDNRKENLRPATVSQNLCNRTKKKSKSRSIYKGLEWDRIQRKWKARIQLNNRKIYLGSFNLEIEAARAYDQAAKKHHREFANLNFPPM